MRSALCEEETMIYTVTLNPAVDCAMELDQYLAGRVNRAREQVLSAGGKGINMSIILSRLGAATMALGFSGGDTGKLLQEDFAAAFVFGIFRENQTADAACFFFFVDIADFSCADGRAIFADDI